jgi:hypothetical protein
MLNARATEITRVMVTGIFIEIVESTDLVASVSVLQLSKYMSIWISIRC